MSVLQRNAITLGGQGEKPLIFLHGYGYGYGCDQTMWRFIAPHFEASHRVVLYDHVGSGRSDLSAYDHIRYNSLHGYADDLIEICEALDLQNVDLAGHSVGGMIAVLAAAKRPELFGRLVLLGPSPCYINQDGYAGGFSRKDIDELLAFLQLNHQAWSASMAPVVMANPDRPELAAELEQYFRANDPDIAHHFARVIYTSDHRADLAAVTHPTLILQCADDVVAPVAVGAFMHAQMRNSRLTVLDTHGHYPQFSAPHIVRDAMAGFLSDADGHNETLAA